MSYCSFHYLLATFERKRRKTCIFRIYKKSKRTTEQYFYFNIKSCLYPVLLNRLELIQKQKCLNRCLPVMHPSLMAKLAVISPFCSSTGKSANSVLEYFRIRWFGQEVTPKIAMGDVLCSSRLEKIESFETDKPSTRRRGTRKLIPRKAAQKPHKYAVHRTAAASAGAVKSL